MKKLLLAILFSPALAFGADTFNVLDSTTFNGNTWATGTGTLSIGAGKTLTSSNTLTLTGTDSSSIAFGAGGTATYTANKLNVFAPTTSAELAGVLSDESGTGVVCMTASCVMTAPNIGAATGASTALSSSGDTGVSLVTVTNTSAASNTTKFAGISLRGTDTAVFGKDVAYIRAYPIDVDYIASSIQFWPRAADALALGGTVTGTGFQGAIGGTTPAAGTFTTAQTGSSSLTLTTGAIGMSKMTASASAPGAGGGKLEFVCGTNAGTAKLVISAGTSATTVTVVDNIGAGVTGC